MEQVTKDDVNQIWAKLAGLQSDVEVLKQQEEKLEEKERKRFTVIDESMAEIWDNEEDEIWNEY